MRPFQDKFILQIDQVGVAPTPLAPRDEEDGNSATYSAIKRAIQSALLHALLDGITTETQHCSHCEGGEREAGVHVPRDAMSRKSPSAQLSTLVSTVTPAVNRLRLLVLAICVNDVSGCGRT
jgi:hypothetical protein